MKQEKCGSREETLKFIGHIMESSGPTECKRHGGKQHITHQAILSKWIAGQSFR